MKTEEFQAQVYEQAKYLGIRCHNMLDGQEHQPDVLAAAISINLLLLLQDSAKNEPLSANDIQVVIDGFMEGAQIEEEYSQMGGTVFQKKSS